MEKKKYEKPITRVHVIQEPVLTVESGEGQNAAKQSLNFNDDAPSSSKESWGETW